MVATSPKKTLLEKNWGEITGLGDLRNIEGIFGAWNMWFSLFSRKTNDFESASGAALKTKGSNGFEGDPAQAS